MKKIIILTWHDVSSAYSCLDYLRKVLSNNNKVEFWSFTEKEKLDKLGRKDDKSFINTWYGKIKKIRVILARIHAFFLCFNKDIIIINDLDFFRVAYLVKKIFPKKSVIHYNTEICGSSDVPYPFNTKRIYAKHADFPDIIIECLKERAEWRKKEFNINKRIYTINNTIPLKEFESLSNNELLNKQIREINLPILIYAGGASFNRNLDDVLDLIPKFKDDVFFLFFLYGTEEQKRVLKEYCKKFNDCNNYKIDDAITRKELLSVMNFCNIGINYYTPSFSVNHKYASPTKFFEYFGCGLNIISTNNEGINHIIENEKIGVCINDDESIENALNRLLKKGLKSRNDIKKIFKNKYCYEIDSRETIEKILELCSMEGK